MKRLQTVDIAPSSSIPRFSLFMKRPANWNKFLDSLTVKLFSARSQCTLSSNVSSHKRSMKRHLIKIVQSRLRIANLRFLSLLDCWRTNCDIFQMKNDFPSRAPCHKSVSICSVEWEEKSVGWETARVGNFVRLHHHLLDYHSLSHSDAFSFLSFRGQCDGKPSLSSTLPSSSWWNIVENARPTVREEMEKENEIQV